MLVKYKCKFKYTSTYLIFVIVLLHFFLATHGTKIKGKNFKNLSINIDFSESIENKPTNESYDKILHLKRSVLLSEKQRKEISNSLPKFTDTIKIGKEIGKMRNAPCDGLDMHNKSQICSNKQKFVKNSMKKLIGNKNKEALSIDSTKNKTEQQKNPILSNISSKQLGTNDSYAYTSTNTRYSKNTSAASRNSKLCNKLAGSNHMNTSPVIGVGMAKKNQSVALNTEDANNKMDTNSSINNLLTSLINKKNNKENYPEIVSLKTKPKEFLEILKAAQESENFEDPFEMASSLYDTFNSDAISKDFGKPKSNFHTSSLHEDSEHVKYFPKIFNGILETPETENTTDYIELLTYYLLHNYTTNSTQENDFVTDNTAYPIDKLFKSNQVKNHKKSSDQNFIYDELINVLHIDSSIDDVKDVVNTRNTYDKESEVLLADNKYNWLNQFSSPSQTLYSKSKNDSRMNTSIDESLTDEEEYYTNESIYELKTANQTKNDSIISGNLRTRSKDVSMTSNVEKADLNSTNIITNETVFNNSSNSPHLITEDEADINDRFITDKEGMADKKTNSLTGLQKAFNYKHDTYPKQENNEKILSIQVERMLRIMNDEVDPCEDFYEYACGRWPEVFPLENKAVDNNFVRLRENLDSVLKSLLEEPVNEEDSASSKIAKTLYEGCMDEDAIEYAGIEPLNSLVKDLGGWPLLEGPSWWGENFNWVELMAKLRRFNNDILLSEWVSADVDNSSMNIIQIDQPELGLPSRNYFLNQGDHKYRMAYLQLMLNTSQFLEAADPAKAFEDIINVLQFEKQLAQILAPVEERRNLSAIQRRFTLSELQEEIPEIDWLIYFQIVLQKTSIQNQPIVVFALGYIKRLVKLIEETRKRTVANYLLTRFVMNRLSNMGKEARKIKQQFLKILYGAKLEPQRWTSCVSYVNGNLGDVVGAMFVKKYYPESSKKDSEELSELIKDSFIDAIRNADWMEENTRHIAIRKIKKMTRNVGYPKYILNDTYLDKIYSELEFNTSLHFGNTIKMLKFHASSEHSKLGAQVTKDEWATTPGVVNAYYSRSKNIIMFPAGILQPPFYHPSFPRVLNFGGIGVVIGHEISHGFDDRGRQFDEWGNLRQWWSDQDVTRFYEKATCMLDQYSAYELQGGLKINAVSTLGENIADNTGLKISYEAFKKSKKRNDDVFQELSILNMTEDQIFFLNFGQIWCEENSREALVAKIRSGQHSPNKYRVIGTLSNSEAFNRAFKCPIGSAMNPSKKCKVW